MEEKWKKYKGHWKKRQIRLKGMRRKYYRREEKNEIKREKKARLWERGMKKK